MSFYKSGLEFRANSRTTGNQREPAIVAGSNGNFTIAWTEDLNNQRSVYTRQFRRDGIALGDDILISRFASEPEITIDSIGNVAIAKTLYNERTNSADITVSSIDANGLRRPGFFAVERSGEQKNAAIVTNPDGSYVIAWVSLGQDGSGAGVYARRFNADRSPATSEISVNTTTASNQNSPAIAMNALGNFVVTWSSFGQDGSVDGVYARRFNKKGEPLSGEIPINITTDKAQSSPAIAMDETGNFAIAWVDSIKGVMLRRFNAKNQPISGEIQINQTAKGVQRSPDIAVDSLGNFVVAWSDDDDDSTSSVYVRRFNAHGAPLSGQLLISTFTTATSPEVAIQPEGDFVVTFVARKANNQGDIDTEVYAQRFEIASQVAVSHPTYKIAENGATARVTVTRTGELQLASQVVYEITGGSATNGQDYRLPTSDFVTFQPGEVSKTIDIPIVQDPDVEGDETLALRLIEVQGGRATLTGVRETVLTIVDDDRWGGGNGSQSSTSDSLPRRTGTNHKDTLTGTVAGEVLVGLRGNDRLNARGGSDILIGVRVGDRRPGRREVDQLNGGGGRDCFVLGDTRHVYYHDGKRNRLGVQDYALIKGFNPKQDTLELHGKASDYRLGTAPVGKGTGIFLENGRTDELIAVVQSNSALRLNSNSFQFV